MACKRLAKVGTERAENKIRKNHEILGMLKTGVSTHAMSKKFNMSYSGAKKKFYQAKIEWNYSGVPGLGR